MENEERTADEEIQINQRNLYSIENISFIKGMGDGDE